MKEGPRTHASAQDKAAAAAFCAGRDVRCPGCGYNLRDSADGVCSECGRALALRTSNELRTGRTLHRLIFAWSAIMGAGPLAVAIAYWRVYDEFPDYGLTAALIQVANVAAVIYGVTGLITLAITRRASEPLSPWWPRIGWVVLLALAAEFVVSVLEMGPLFTFSLGLPF